MCMLLILAGAGFARRQEEGGVGRRFGGALGLPGPQEARGMYTTIILRWILSTVRGGVDIARYCITVRITSLALVSLVSLVSDMTWQPPCTAVPSRALPRALLASASCAVPCILQLKCLLISFDVLLLMAPQLLLLRCLFVSCVGCKISTSIVQGNH